MLWGFQMPLIRINAIGRDPALHAAQAGLDSVLHEALNHPGPVVIMVHGYRFQPGDPIHCPHDHIFSCATEFACNKAVSWPRQLGFVPHSATPGLAIAFGWHARGTLQQAKNTATDAATALARLISSIRAISPNRPINLIAHSLGAQVVLEAFRPLARYDVARIVLMNGATYRTHAQYCLAGPAGRTCEVFNVTSRENAVFDRLFSLALPSAITGDLPISQGIPARNVLSVRIDQPTVRTALSNLGFPIAPGLHRVCHWSTYLRPGLFAFYRALLFAPDTLPMASLQTLLDLSPHKTREVQRTRQSWLLPYGTGQAS